MGSNKPVRKKRWLDLKVRCAINKREPWIGLRIPDLLRFPRLFVGWLVTIYTLFSTLYALHSISVITVPFTI